MNILHLNKLKKILICFLIQLLVSTPVLAIDLDHTVDDAIRKNYNVGGSNLAKPIPKNNVSTQQTEKFPSLPSLPKYSSATTVKKTYTKTQPPKNILPLRKGMTFEILSSNAISDRQRKGTNIVFNAKRDIKTAYYTIPKGTKFVGKIVESHTPQLTGNGGLVCLEVVSIVFAGKYQHIDSRVLKVGDKNIFLEDIKGKRSYWSNTINKGKWGRNTFHKMNGISSNLAKDKLTAILSPITFLYGATLGVVSTAASPIVSIFCKGKSLYIPVGTTFKIKLEEDAKLYY